MLRSHRLTLVAAAVLLARPTDDLAVPRMDPNAADRRFLELMQVLPHNLR
jgi:hypothetical protein